MGDREGCALVTGGTRGIGAAVVERLRADGWPVVALARTGGDVQADVSDPEAVAAAFDAVEERHGPVLVLVNNAGTRRDGLAIRMSDEDWNAVLDVNLDGAFHCTRRALGPMLKARWGRIVNVSSVVAAHANPGQANYAASKAGLLALTRTIAREMGRKGITCNAVTPGIVATDMTRDVVDDLVGLVPAGRAGTPADVAAAVGFLCSEEAAYVNGATLAVDGALTA
jgi:NAD(P)-dependent dehydrogenase (short-subunit alcohol dehydrogenase family)